MRGAGDRGEQGPMGKIMERGSLGVKRMGWKAWLFYRYNSFDVQKWDSPQKWHHSRADTGPAQPLSNSPSGVAHACTPSVVARLLQNYTVRPKITSDPSQTGVNMSISSSCYPSDLYNIFLLTQIWFLKHKCQISKDHLFHLPNLSMSFITITLFSLQTFIVRSNRQNKMNTHKINWLAFNTQWVKFKGSPFCQWAEELPSRKHPLLSFLPKLSVKQHFSARHLYKDKHVFGLFYRNSKIILSHLGPNMVNLLNGQVRDREFSLRLWWEKRSKPSFLCEA